MAHKITVFIISGDFFLYLNGTHNKHPKVTIYAESREWKKFKKIPHSKYINLSFTKNILYDLFFHIENV